MHTIKFGTDGVRGKANVAPIDALSMCRIGQAAAGLVGPGALVFVGRDTRASGPMLEAALTAGLASGGANVLLAGVVPTAAVGLAVRERGAAMGVMLTASHNPAEDNGIKFFGRSGDKLDEKEQDELQDRINANQAPDPGINIGRIDQTSAVQELYAQAVRASAPGTPLKGMHLVLDCAHGAASFLAPEILRAMGAKLDVLHANPDGKNINLECGSTAPQILQQRVTALGADAGIAFDGDADRVLLVDEKGGLIDGDLLLASIARDWAERGLLRGEAVVATHMSNLGLEVYLQDIGLKLERTQVGDRYVAAKLNTLGANLGGEQSGHLRMPDLCPSGDGLIAAVAALRVLGTASKPASMALRPFSPLPQFMHNVARPDGPDPMDNPTIIKACQQAEGVLGDTGRLLVRPSGTEPLVRVMAECDNPHTARQAIKLVTDALGALG
ncbi:MAG: phosphoglucosamine mutase [Robiginitomaculum sp.]|nr:phosphoglucosamine mutase [Robiginitomaculum sp.]MDQ7078875.1 phosphoglucosamine mutase [Robiginitomaculum sp.]